MNEDLKVIVNYDKFQKLNEQVFLYEQIKRETENFIEYQQINKRYKILDYIENNEDFEIVKDLLSILEWTGLIGKE